MWQRANSVAAQSPSPTCWPPIPSHPLPSPPIPSHPLPSPPQFQVFVCSAVGTQSGYHLPKEMVDMGKE